MVAPGVSLAFPVRRDQQGAEVFGVSATTVWGWFSVKKNTSPGDVLLMESLVRENRPRLEVRAEAFVHEKHEGQTR